MKYDIELERGGGVTSGPGMPVGMNDEENEHPTVTLEYDEPFNLPKEGTITFKYCELERTERKVGDDTLYTCRLALKEITDAEAEKETDTYNRDTGAEDALDALAKEKSDEGEGE